MEKIGFVILHYGDLSVTSQCIRSILSMDGREKAEIILVDNDSGDATDDKWEMYAGISGLHILKNEEAHGFSHANNLGYRYARNVLKADCILILNNDIEFIQKDFIRRLEDSAVRTGGHIIAPDIRKQSSLEPQNPLDTRIRTEAEAIRTIILNRAALLCFPVIYPVLLRQQKRADRNRVRRKKENREYYRMPHEGIVPFGACLIFTKPFIDGQEDAFMPETEFYYEEYLLADRCFREGYRICYDPSLRILHETGKATEKSTGSEKNKMRFMMENTAESCRIYLRELRK